MKLRTYHLGLLRDWTGKSKTLVLQARRGIDFLSCELWVYLGQRQTTKQSLRENRAVLLKAFNQEYSTDFEHLVID
jgi:hypothetical protein